MSARNSAGGAKADNKKLKIVVSPKPSGAGSRNAAQDSPSSNGNKKQGGKSMDVDLMAVDAPDTPKSSKQIHDRFSKHSLFDMREMLATSFEFERLQSEGAELSRLLTPEELERQAIAKKYLSSITSLNTLTQHPISGFETSHEGYLTYVTRRLLEDEVEASKQHFFTTKLSEREIRARYFEPTSMPAVLASIVDIMPMDDGFIEDLSNNGVPSADDVAEGKPVSGTVSSSVLRRLDEIYDAMEVKLDESDIYEMIRENRMEDKVKAIKKRQRPADAPSPRYTAFHKSSIGNANPDSNRPNQPSLSSSMPASSSTFSAPPKPAFLKGPASKKRLLYVKGSQPYVEYQFVDMELQEEDELGSGNLGSVSRDWMMVVKRDIPRVGRVHTDNIRVRRENAHVLAKAARDFVQAKIERSREEASHAQHRAKSLSKSIYSFIRTNEKEWKRQAEREAEASRRAVQETEEKERTAKKLNFLITQTELYSHFMSKKLGIEDAEQEVEKMKEGDLAGAKSGATNGLEGGAQTMEEAEQMARARQDALVAYKAQRAKIDSFDQQSASMRGGSGGAQNEQSAGAQSSTLTGHRKTGGIVNRSNMPGAANLEGRGASGMVEQPIHLTAQLKPYQVKGLNWLANLYEQGINGILADEMGLGKTVQTISLLAHLAETRGIWGPFLVISPTSTLPNWANEIAKFYPAFKVLPYYGLAKQRASLRKILSPNYLHRADSPAHIVVTSYNLVVQDEKYISKIHWEYMILDEAHAIKSASSVRWQTLLSFGQTRNRLLLTGTPIQNNMAELWALLHFIMPTLFDSHNEFAEWFSKDIEDHVAGAATLNEHQLNRLHLILKPFMLRRVKVDVQNELPSKTEVLVPCDLTSRQRALYTGIRKRLSIAELFDRINIPTNKMAMEKQTKTLMNIVMQFRNVCNHPEIIDKSETQSPLQFAPLPPPVLAYSTIVSPASRNYFDIKIPRILYRETMLWAKETFEGGTDAEQTTRRLWLHHKFNIFSQDHIHKSIFGGRFESGERKKSEKKKISFVMGSSSSSKMDVDEQQLSQTENMKQGDQNDANVAGGNAGSKMQKSKASNGGAVDRILYDNDNDHCWDFVRLMDSCPQEVEWVAEANPILRWFHALASDERDSRLAYEQNSSEKEGEYVATMPMQRKNNILRITPISDPVAHHKVTSWESLNELACTDPERLLSQHDSLIRLVNGAFNPTVWCAVPTLYCADRRFQSYQSQFESNNFVTNLLLGTSRSEGGPEFICRQVSSVRLSPPTPGIAMPYLSTFGSNSVRVPRYAELVRDSGKLRKLDQLLKELKRGAHRVLVYSQFTEVLDLLEDFMTVRGHKSVRLDGSSKLDERRDVVDAFQTDPSIFVFLLSTRAGGLGINLTAADTVVFYDSDWNPTMDAQAMDRAHRLGQTRPVTVYRLITRNSIEERILQRAKQKGAIQNLVIQGGRFNLAPEDADVDIFKPTEMMDLLLDDPMDENGANGSGANGAGGGSGTGDRPKKRTGIINPIKMGMKRSSKPTKPVSKPAPMSLTTDERIEPATNSAAVANVISSDSNSKNPNTETKQPSSSSMDVDIEGI